MRNEERGQALLPNLRGGQDSSQRQGCSNLGAAQKFDLLARLA
jgi:hypothetical protein